ncbi:MAG: hypothetical protein UT60_C0007G0036 [candidate division CPR2 bacterium GW2011_GWD2_39_7]|nr:MAG: hypothetical protein UT60_C0007G0036 [candidate division CPR2 bacterium GW2011_GWD2_39_7]
MKARFLTQLLHLIIILQAEDVSIQDRPGTVWLGGGIAPKNVQDITYTGRIISVVKKELDGKPFNEWLRDENENHVIKNGYPVPEHIDGLDGFRFVYSEEISADMPFIYVSNGFSVYIIRFESSGGESDSEGLRVFEEVIKSLNLN